VVLCIASQLVLSYGSMLSQRPCSESYVSDTILPVRYSPYRASSFRRTMGNVSRMWDSYWCRRRPILTSLRPILVKEFVNQPLALVFGEAVPVQAALGTDGTHALAP